MRADLIVLKDGRRLSGFYLEETSEGIFFKTRQGAKQFIKHTELEHMELGYPGTPMCVEKKITPGQSNCDSLLYKVEGDHVLIAEGEGFLKLKKIPLSTVKKIHLMNDSSDPDRLAASLPRGVPLEIDQGNRKIKGRVVGQQAGMLIVEDKEGNRTEIKNDQIVAAVYEPGSEIKTGKASFYDYYPGFYQYRRGDVWTGYGLGGGFTASLLGFAYSYYAAQSVAAEASSDPTVILFNNQSYLEEFSAHQQNQRMFGFLAVLIYGYHVLDMYYLNPTVYIPGPAKKQMSWFMDFNTEHNPAGSLLPDYHAAAFRQSRHPPSYSRLRAGLRIRF